MGEKIKKKCKGNNSWSSSYLAKYLNKQYIEYYTGEIEDMLRDCESKLKPEDIYKIDKQNKKDNTDVRRSLYGVFTELSNHYKKGVMDALAKGDLKHAFFCFRLFCGEVAKIDDLPYMKRQWSGLKDMERLTELGVLRGQQLKKLTPGMEEKISKFIIQEILKEQRKYHKQDWSHKYVLDLAQEEIKKEYGEKVGYRIMNTYFPKWKYEKIFEAEKDTCTGK